MAGPATSSSTPYWQGPPPQHAHLRVGNEDREQVVEHIKAAYADGRFEKAEFDERVDRAMTAQVHADLMPIMNELYGTPSAPAVPPPYPYPHPQPPSYPRQPAPPSVSSERSGAAAAHILGILGLSFVGPLIMLLTMGKTSPYVRMHAVEALNFHLTLLGATVLLSITVVGLVAVPFVWIGAFVAGIVGGVAALGHGSFQYPLTLRLVK
ncbi:DUF1707 and DUF4870 domain-containing protein [Spongiactinospora sp. TRM90649]|uniref:DUF1707 and DUF4870 domain-containing protein n=1 Tax=Spongiactinospora sp. TRM90649 TaxID=3031114 RepID=UPI0023F6E9DB|nr:DUF1707 and DUF4870 domain-containing protein [Spongiactinospora sp. TRM90649]MDF5755325.1 DUF1707 and DUF4870 domain-containing protein [Spongiactinospora sp. TRM90649]